MSKMVKSYGAEVRACMYMYAFYMYIAGQ